ncbi:hypothetical protein BDZ85DRAFT_277250 [Elsinoe ampelina]|uniref:Rhodopsin domain-containing protein n=1 Tax=Elsinoe ampelina TaxID=302913 RepID=A0A6A6GP42_9PEZI|nr:hypothetical protein BDZ85DRAFT_277250 [Elsinoe ampelina]
MCYDARASAVIKTSRWDVLACDRPQDTKAPVLQAQTVLICVAIVLLVLARFASRRTRLWWDDWLHLAAASTFVAAIALQVQAIPHGLGYHAWDPRSLVGRTEALKLIFFWLVLHRITSCLVKVSLLALYIRVFLNKRFRIITGVVIGLTISSTIVMLSLLLTNCKPVSAFWDDSIADGVCNHSNSIDNVRFGLNISGNIIIFLLPLAVIRSLGLQIRERFALGIVFCVGLSVIALSSLRAQLRKDIQSFGDNLYNTADLVTIASWEIFAAFICITAPTLGSLARRMRGKKLRRTNQDRDLSDEFDGPVRGTIPARRSMPPPRRPVMGQAQEMAARREDSKRRSQVRVASAICLEEGRFQVSPVSSNAPYISHVANHNGHVSPLSGHDQPYPGRPFSPQQNGLQDEITPPGEVYCSSPWQRGEWREEGVVYHEKE